MIFGSEAFSEYVGELKVAQLANGEGDDAPDDAELAFRQRRRCVELASKLVKRIQDRVDGGDKDAFFERCKSDGSDLAKTPFGATLTRLIARSYIGAANQYLVSGPASIGQSIADGAHSAHNLMVGSLWAMRRQRELAHAGVLGGGWQAVVGGWAHHMVQHPEGTVPLKSVAIAYQSHALSKGWLTKREPHKLTAKGFGVAASFLKR